MLSIFTTHNPQKYWLQTVIYVGLLLALLMWYRRQDLTPYYEGFSQNSRFILKRESEIYDEFYVEIYDQLMKPEQYNDFAIDQMIEMTKPNPRTSVFLDIGSGTGHLVERLNHRGYNVFGVDQSKAMVDHADKKCPDVHIKHGNALEPMLYEKNTFTHILCTGFTIYQIDNKIDFLRNCFYWLQPGGYLILHLVDRNQFDTIVPGGKPPLFESPQLYAKKRITDTIVDFIDFEYKGSYRFLDQNKTAIFQETFTDGATKNVRQNEITLYMDDIDTILKASSYCGFLVQGNANMKSCIGDEYQYLYILERPQ